MRRERGREEDARARGVRSRERRARRTRTFFLMYFFSSSAIAAAGNERRALPGAPRPLRRRGRGAVREDAAPLNLVDRRANRDLTGARTVARAMFANTLEAPTEGDSTNGRSSGETSSPFWTHGTSRRTRDRPPRVASMNYFTKQELQGGARYGGKCKVGNWNENVTLDEVRRGTRDRSGSGPATRASFPPPIAPSGAPRTRRR